MFVTTYYLLPPDEGVMSSTTLDLHYSENRAINALCDKCLLVAAARNTHTIDWGITRIAKKELRGEAF